jgi:hypothetical protein
MTSNSARLRRGIRVQSVDHPRTRAEIPQLVGDGHRNLVAEPDGSMDIAVRGLFLR